MPIDTTPSTVATNALQAIPFSSLIGGPLKAAIEAQAIAAKTTYEFIKEVGLYIDPATGQTKTVQVVFQFQRGNQMVNLNVPLLAIVPIPYIAVNEITIDFLAKISAEASTVNQTSESTSYGGEISGGGRFWFIEVNFKANYSSKKDSTSTAQSKYSVEYTMNVHVAAGQDSMPAGLASVLNMLQEGITATNPDGKLEISARTLTVDASTPNITAIEQAWVEDSVGLKLTDSQTITFAVPPTSGLTLVKAVGTGPDEGTSLEIGVDSTGKAGVNVKVADPKKFTSNDTAFLELSTTIPIKDDKGNVRQRIDKKDRVPISILKYIEPVPIVTSVTPGAGPVAGGTQVTIAGINFLANANVQFGGTDATSIAVAANGLSITATTPAHDPGAVDVTVINPDGQKGFKTGAFLYQGPAPTVTGVTPTQGPVAGGTPVDVNGTGFQNGAAVRFGGLSAANATVVSATKITATTPAGTAGAVTVSVENPDGQKGQMANGFTYSATQGPPGLPAAQAQSGARQGKKPAEKGGMKAGVAPPPIPKKVSPSQGPTDGGTVVKITGINFEDGAQVYFGGTPALNISVDQKGMCITASSPSYAQVGPVDVTVVNPDGQNGVVQYGFTYLAPGPQVRGVDPYVGTTDGYTPVSITGSGFDENATVTFGGVDALDVSWHDQGLIQAFTPPHTEGTVDVIVTNPNGRSGILHGGFTYKQDAGQSC
jgi:hypothetical protein